jgi:hypothetical protein
MATAKIIKEGVYGDAIVAFVGDQNGQDQYFSILTVSVNLPTTDAPPKPIDMPGRRINLDNDIYVKGASFAILEEISGDTSRLTFQIKIAAKKPFTGIDKILIDPVV